ncbi:MAG TPA: hypothetical protein VGS19_06715 [Streptosporangiaceae bacterium]|nr:hypothetical protein [Streptosporangiaceae bacterium]
MEPGSEAVPYGLATSDRHSGHYWPSITVYRTLDPWREHWAALHHQTQPPPACPEPDLSEHMLIEVTAGQTPTGMARLEVTAVTLSHGTLLVQAGLHYPDGAATADMGSPFAALTTPAFDGPVSLDLSTHIDIV